jgi:hypothetical protein
MLVSGQDGDGCVFSPSRLPQTARCRIVRREYRYIFLLLAEMLVRAARARRRRAEPFQSCI